MNKNIFALTILLFSIVALAKNEPPKTYKLKCKYECAELPRAWIAKQNVTVYSSPKVGKILTTVKKGEKITVLDHEDHHTPVAVRVLSDHPPFKKDSTVYVLGNLGEGTVLIWNEGKIIENEEIGCELEALNLCSHGCELNNTCWAKLSGKFTTVTWSKIKTVKNILGWTQSYDSFEDFVPQ